MLRATVVCAVASTECVLPADRSWDVVQASLEHAAITGDWSAIVCAQGGAPARYRWPSDVSEADAQSPAAAVYQPDATVAVDAAQSGKDPPAPIEDASCGKAAKKVRRAVVYIGNAMASACCRVQRMCVTDTAHRSAA